MEKMIVLVVVLALIGLALKAMKGKRKTDGSDGSEIKPQSATGPAPYFKKAPLTEPEQVMFHRLREALPEQIILAQVAMSAMVGIRKNENWQTQFNEISRKYVDFVVCNQDFSMRAIIELDDSTHQRGERIKADAIKDAAFQAIGVPVVRFDVREMPTVETIRSAIN